MAVEAGRAALAGGGAVERVVLVSRDFPLLETSNAAVLLAGLGLDPELEVDERLGGAPATVDAVSSARPRTLIIGSDLEPAGAAAILTAERGLQVRTAARVARSLPVRTRKSTGAVHDYGDPRLLHERGLIASLAAAWLDTPAAVAGVDHERAADLCLGDPPALPTRGASSSLFALAGMAERGTTGPLVAVEQAILSGITVSGGVAHIHRRVRARVRCRRAITSPVPRSRSRWPPTSGRSRRKSVGRQDGSATPTTSTSHRDTASNPTAPWPPTTSWSRCRAPVRSIRKRPSTSRCPVCGRRTHWSSSTSTTSGCMRW